MDAPFFDKPNPIIGVLQLLPLPGALGWRGRIDQVIARAEQEATALATGGVDAILVENTFDTPYATDRMDAAGAVAMGLIIRRMMHFTQVPFGVSVLRNDPETALAIAMNVGARFIRVPVLTGVALSESGLLEGKYRQLAAYRKTLMADRIAVLADVGLEKSLPISGQSTRTLQHVMKEAVDVGGANGLILTDTQLSADNLAALKQTVDVPVYYDFTHPLAEVAPYLTASDGLVVSNCIKKAPPALGDASAAKVDLIQVEELRAQADVIRQRNVSHSPVA